MDPSLPEEVSGVIFRDTPGNSQRPGGEPRALLLGRAQCRVKVSVAFLSTVFRPVMTWVKSRSPPAP